MLTKLQNQYKVDINKINDMDDFSKQYANFLFQKNQAKSSSSLKYIEERND